ncbi:hypothetical protein RMATCC62417_08239 [Rhizopus microsporus]|nr:hypothetical protein RMATCC62417_08239 [Rhizopus microsporus]
MSNYNNNDTPLSKNNNNGCLNQYYRYVVGMTPPNQSPIVDINQYQKLYVDTLVDITTLTIRSSWPMENIAAQSVVDTHAFVRHLLKRSRATRSTLQLAIFYLFRIRPHIDRFAQHDSIIKCGRRMFLAALICAHKYLYDNTFTNASWAKISRLPAKEISQAERAILQMLDYRLFVSTELYQKFESQLKEAVPNTPTNTTTTCKRPCSFEQEPCFKKVKSNKTQIVHGIPTPQDDQVELI